MLSNGLSGMDPGSSRHPGRGLPQFYETLPAASTLFLRSGTAAPDDGHARFVAVKLQAVTQATIFPVSFVAAGGANSYTAGAAAVAGNDAVSCQYTPMFVCNPYETSTRYLRPRTG